MERKYNRILIKLSGEAIGEENGRGLSTEKIERVVEQIIEVSNSGIEVAIVIGAGNFWRGKYGKEYLKRTTSDYMGMLATVLNALALRDMFESKGKGAAVLTSLDMPIIAERYTKIGAEKYLRSGSIVIFACGTGSPYFTTDTGAALRGVEMEADILLLAKNVDGVYNKDPRRYSDAVKYDKITFEKAINDKLGVMDITALTLCMENNLPISVFDLNEVNSIKRAVLGENVGTIVENEV